MDYRIAAQLDREAEQIAADYENGVITGAEYRRQMSCLCMEAREAECDE